MKKIYQGKTKKIFIGIPSQEDSKRSLCILQNPDPRSYRPSDSYSMSQYFRIYKLMTGKAVSNQSLYGLVDIAIDHLQERINSPSGSESPMN